jgi:nucleotide-binding universal stress UspA family protein
MNILLAVDGSPASRNTTLLLNKLPLPDHTNVEIVSCFEPLNFDYYLIPDHDAGKTSEYNRKARFNLDEMLHEYERLLNTRFITRTTVLEGKAEERILQHLEQGSYDLCALGSRGLNPIKRFFLGSVSESILQRSHCSVLISHSYEVPSKNKLSIVGALDGSPSAKKALDLICSWDGNRLDNVTLISASEMRYHYGMSEAVLVNEAWKSYHNAIDSMLEQAKQRCDQQLGKHVNAFHLSTVGDAADAVAAHIEENPADLLVTGYSGRSRLESFYIGSFSLKFVRHSDCPIWVVK